MAFFRVLFLPLISPHFCGMITMKDMLAKMKTGSSFSVVVCSYDRKRKKGGEWKEYPEAQLVQANNDERQVGRPLTNIERLRADLYRSKKKNPHHREHFTRNIRILQNGHPTGMIVTIHPPLVDTFNGKTLLI